MFRLGHWRSWKDCSASETRTHHLSDVMLMAWSPKLRSLLHLLMLWRMLIIWGPHMLGFQTGQQTSHFMEGKYFFPVDYRFLWETFAYLSPNLYTYCFFAFLSVCHLRNFHVYLLRWKCKILVPGVLDANTGLSVRVSWTSGDREYTLRVIFFCRQMIFRKRTERLSDQTTIQPNLRAVYGNT